MAETKACNLTEAEIKRLIFYHGWDLSSEYNLDGSDINDRIERINYLHKRLKTFSEPAEEKSTAVANEAKPTAQGWGAPSNG